MAEKKKQRWVENRELIEANQKAIEQMGIADLPDDYDALKKLVFALVNAQAILTKQLELSSQVGFRRPGQIKNAMKEVAEMKEAMED
jgi:hypothetical protein